MDKKLDLTLENEFFKFESCLDDSLRKRAYEYCKKFLGGAWALITLEQFDLRYIKGGLTNYLYLCQLPIDCSTVFDEPNRVLLRLYGDILDQATKYNEAVVFNILSERKIAPKLLGVFPAGRLEEFLDTRCLQCHELRDMEISKNIAIQMAIFHNMKMPITKDDNWLFSRIDKWLIEAMLMMNQTDSTNSALVKIQQLFQNVSLVDEVQSLKKFVLEIQSPLVLCHNDIQEGNVMFTNKDQNNKDICLIDFEYSSYNYRGFDFGNLFCEWIFKNIDDCELGFSYDFANYPNHEQQLNFVVHYLIKQSEILQGTLPSIALKLSAQPDKIIEEAKRFSLVSHLFWGLWSFVQHRLSKIEYNYLEYAYARLLGYVHFKKVFNVNF